MRALLLSNSTNYGATYMEHAKEAISNFLGNTKEILFVPYAGVTVDYETYTNTVQKTLQPFGIKITSIHTHKDPKQAIENAQAIAVGGGNTFRLVQLLQEYDLIDTIRNATAKAIPYIGWSAGSNVAGPTLCTTNDMPIVQPKSFDCLNLVPYQINPHYSETTVPNHGGESRKARIMEYITLSKTDVVCLPEGSWLQCEGDVTTYHGGESMKVYSHPDQVIDFEPTEAHSYFK
ncbi:MAG: dipeptidase E [bacterium]|jgi:dipeptidase E